MAWKPYTHNYTAQQVWSDVVDDGMVTLAGKHYPVDPRIRVALWDARAYYNAGAVGPDGFPDLTYGQAIIHPVETGKWLELLWNEAWAAQSDDNVIWYDDAERKQILAFTYGFMVHAAGDVWGHTLANDFSRGVFPEVTEILTSPEKAGIALRHIIAEGHVGDATPGFDGNPEFAPLFDWNSNIFDWSDDSTTAYEYAVPTRFVYEVLVKKSSATPVAATPGAYMDARGPIIGLFLVLQDTIQTRDTYNFSLGFNVDEALEFFKAGLALLENRAHELEEECSIPL